MNFIQRIRSTLEELGLHPRLQLVLVGAVGLLLLWGTYQLATGPEYVPAYTDLELQKVSEIESRLTEAGVEYRLEDGGSTLRVKQADLARTRVLLAGEELPEAGRPGMELFDQPSWGMTDFSQRVNYRRALEGELQRTIGRLDGVREAKVHLAMHENTVFRSSDRPSEASVVLGLESRGALPQRMVRGITFLVASSVDGMLSENVTVLDDRGRVLSTSLEPNSRTGLERRKLEFQQQVEGHLRSKAQQIVTRVVGRENVRVRVAADLNFDKVERTVRAVEPDERTMTSEERAEIIPGDSAAGAASVQSKTDYAATRSVERFSSGTGNVERLTVSVLVNENAGPDGGGVPEQRLQRIQSLVANAVGIDPERGDRITVESVPFTDRLPPGAEPGNQGFGWRNFLREWQRPLVALIAVGLAFFLVLKVLRSVREMSRDEQALPTGATDDVDRRLEGDEDTESMPASEPEKPYLESEEERSEPPQKIVPGGDRDQRTRERVAAGVREEPELAARVVKVWMNDA
ncbi:MAG: flagellar basal-body MS-ring/collar protein FliF [Candidatus Palauibacterales bacterium]|nr:flagellar basal-body MS-ring/collar protein FliF [Candidatus Palauibacterales bacterium]